MVEKIFERVGIFKHHLTSEEIDAGNIKGKQLAAEYLTDKITLEEYKSELDKLPKIDLVKLAQYLNHKD